MGKIEIHATIPVTVTMDTADVIGSSYEALPADKRERAAGRAAANLANEAVMALGDQGRVSYKFGKEQE